jgi:DNA-binding XRE family transcriptional regulator
MAPVYGQAVQFVKDPLSSVFAAPLRDNVSVAKKKADTLYRQAFLSRTKAMRKGAGFKQAGMAKALGIEAEAYAKYEQRTMLPHHLIAPFCELTGHDPWFLITGKGPAHKPSRLAG